MLEGVPAHPVGEPVEQLDGGDEAEAEAESHEAAHLADELDPRHLGVAQELEDVRLLEVEGDERDVVLVRVVRLAEVRRSREDGGVLLRRKLDYSSIILKQEEMAL